MSTDLSKRKFTDSAQNGALSWLFEGFRTRMRDVAQTVRMEAAWNTWPAIHSIAKNLQEQLTTDADLEGYKQDSMHRLAARMADLYPTPKHFPHPDDPARQREAIAMAVGGGLTEDNQNIWGATYEDVFALYEAEYADYSTNTPVPDHAAESAHEKDMDQWAVLDAAVGGDMFTDPAKLAVMRQIDRETTGAPWEEFHARVVEAIQTMPQAEGPTTPDIA